MPRTSQGKFVTESAKVFQEGDDYWHQGRYEDARKSYALAARLYHDDGDDQGEAFVLSRLGELNLSLDDFAEAEKAFKAAAELVKNKDFAVNTYAEVLIKLSQVYTASGEVSMAFRTLQAAKEAAESIHNRQLAGDAYEQEAFAYLENNQEDKALAAYRKAAEMFRAEGISLKEATVLRAIARLEMKRKNYDQAHELLERCRNLYRENGDLLGEASALSAIGCLRYLIRDIYNARKALMKSVYLYGKVSYHYAEAEALLYLARVEAFDKEQGDYERAKLHYRRAAELFDFTGNEMMKNVTLEEYGNFLNRIQGC